MNGVLALALMIIVPALLKGGVPVDVPDPGTLERMTNSPTVNITIVTEELSNLTPPEERVPLAVYELRDKTGQYKDDEIGTRKSTIMSQGAVEMLITALDRSGQFKVLDRVIFQHILTEQDLRGKKRLVNDDSYPHLNKLIGAKYIIEGAVTEYNCDVVTSGVGLTIGGKGGRYKYAKATAAIDLRVTDVSTGEVVKTLSMRDKMVGKMVGLNIFAFFNGASLYEFELGKADQEPINLVIRRLIEHMVLELVKSGVFE